ncbi:energy-coupling factor transporter transmembrane component T family protein [Rothia sp. CCM 9417]|uniref:energy-coupling factor transporter transmembrane component T family protein n=1 Tax=unclassified Rothia (in: high G+C Gram-positive bacteria) TaxID=2689056 RepID=UPI003AD41FDA
MAYDPFAATAERQGALGRINAGVKLGATFALTLGLLLTQDWVTSLTVLCLELLALRLLGLSPLALLGRFWPVLFGALLSGWSTSLLAEKTGSTLLHFGPLWVSTGSAAVGIALMLRGLAMLLPGIFLIATTDPTDIADSLAQSLKLPARFVLGALAALRLVGLMMAEWNTLGQARRARGLGSQDTLWLRARTLGGQTFALLVQAIRRGSRLATTMEARGFGPGPRTWARVPSYRWADLWFALGTLGLLVCGYLLAAYTGNLTWVWQ